MGNTCKPMAVPFQCMTKSTTNKIKKKELENSPLLGYVSYGQPAFGLGSVVFGKSPGPTDQRKPIGLSSLVHDLSLCGISVFGSVCLRATECSGKSEKTFQRLLCGGAPVKVKYQKTGKTSWTTSCFENL